MRDTVSYLSSTTAGSASSHSTRSSVAGGGTGAGTNIHRLRSTGGAVGASNTTTTTPLQPPQQLPTTTQPHKSLLLPPLARATPPQDELDTSASELDLSGGGDLVIDLDQKTSSEQEVAQETSVPKTPNKEEDLCAKPPPPVGEGERERRKNISGEGVTKMSNSVEHQAIVDKGLKMKIKRKGLSAASSRSASADSASSSAGVTGVGGGAGATPATNSQNSNSSNGASAKGEGVVSNSKTANSAGLGANSRVTNSSAVSSGGVEPKQNGVDKSNASKAQNNRNVNKKYKDRSAKTQGDSSTAVSTSSNSNSSSTGTPSTVGGAGGADNGVAELSVELSRLPGAQYNNSTTGASGGSGSSVLRRDTTAGTAAATARGAVGSSDGAGAGAGDSAADPYDFNSKMEEVKPLALSAKKQKNDKMPGSTSSQPGAAPGAPTSSSAPPTTTATSAPSAPQEGATAPTTPVAPPQAQGGGVAATNISVPSATVPGKLDASVTTASIGTATEPDCLGPCDPGTSVMLEGIVWQEVNGVLVVNVTWRGKTYVGSLLDATKNDWSAPRFSDSPAPEETLPSGRHKRRAAAAALNDMTTLDRRLRKGRRTTANSVAASMPAPQSPARSEYGVGRRKRGAPPDPEPDAGARSNKRSRSSSSSNVDDVIAAGADLPLPEVFVDGVIECPHPNCSKRYKHINGLRYHQTHAHNSRKAQNAADKPATRPQTPNLEPTSNKSTPRGRKKKRATRDAVRDNNIKSAPTSPSGRSSTPNSVHNPSSPADKQTSASGKPNRTQSPAPQAKEAKKSKKKKSKDKDKEHRKDKSGTVVKREAASVIKSVPPTKETKLPPELTKQPSPMDKGDGSNGSEGTDTARPPSSLSMHSPLQVNTDVRASKPVNNGDAQSPSAYSDISDANDTSLNNENHSDSVVKVKEEPKDKLGDVTNSSKSDSSRALGEGALYPNVYQSYLRQAPGSFVAGTATPAQNSSSAANIATGNDSLGVAVKQEKPSSDSMSKTNQEYNQRMLEQRMNERAVMTAYRGDPSYHPHLMNSDPMYRQAYEKHMEDRRRMEEQQSKESQLRNDHMRQHSPSLSLANKSVVKDLHGVPKSSPSAGPPPLVSERDRQKAEAEAKAKFNDAAYAAAYEKQQQMQRYYKYSQPGGPQDPRRSDDLVKDMSIKSEPRTSTADGALKNRDSVKPQDQPLDLKDKRMSSSPGAAPDKASSAGAMPYGHYAIPPGFIAGFGARGLPVEHQQAMLRAMNPVGLLGYPASPAALMHPYRYPPGMERDRHTSGSTSGSDTQGAPPKALERLQQHAQYLQHNAAAGVAAGSSPSSHKIHELASAEKTISNKHSGRETTPSRGSTGMSSRGSTPPAPPSASAIRSTSSPPPNGKSDDASGGGPASRNSSSRSPPPQRHLHHHHHTHVVGPAQAYMYDPYGAAAAMLPGGPPPPGASTPSPAGVPTTTHPFQPPPPPAK